MLSERNSLDHLNFFHSFRRSTKTKFSDSFTLVIYLTKTSVLYFRFCDKKSKKKEREKKEKEKKEKKVICTNFMKSLRLQGEA